MTKPMKMNSQDYKKMRKLPEMMITKWKKLIEKSEVLEEVYAHFIYKNI
jgi:hypothetical protein